MSQDLNVPLEDRPGMLAKLGETLGGAGINIDGVAGDTGGPSVHVLVDDGAAAHAALEAAGFQPSAPQDVVVLSVDDRPGMLGEVCRKAANAGVNINLAYLGTDTRLVLGSDDFAGLKGAVGG
jgi:hypothetical protein